MRLYDRLFTTENPNDVPAGKEFTDLLNPDSLEVLTGCQVEPQPRRRRGRERASSSSAWATSASTRRCDAGTAGLQPHRHAARHLGEDREARRLTIGISHHGGTEGTEDSRRQPCPTPTVDQLSVDLRVLGAAIVSKIFLGESSLRGTTERQQPSGIRVAGQSSLSRMKEGQGEGDPTAADRSKRRCIVGQHRIAPTSILSHPGEEADRGAGAQLLGLHVPAPRAGRR